MTEPTPEEAIEWGEKMLTIGPNHAFWSSTNASIRVLLDLAREALRSREREPKVIGYEVQLWVNYGWRFASDHLANEREAAVRAYRLADGAGLNPRLVVTSVLDDEALYAGEPESLEVSNG